jgi:hypothetical protein
MPTDCEDLELGPVLTRVGSSPALLHAVTVDDIKAADAPIDAPPALRAASLASDNVTMPAPVASLVEDKATPVNTKRAMPTWMHGPLLARGLLASVFFHDALVLFGNRSEQLVYLQK